jgi:hypothetical protein
MELSFAPGFVAFDLDCPTSTRGTRRAPDATRTEAARVLWVDGAENDSAIKRYCAGRGDDPGTDPNA